MGTRDERLKAEYEAMRNFASDVVQWQTVCKRVPADEYHFMYDLASISGMDQQGQPQIVRKVWTIAVSLPSNYPWGKPKTHFLGDQILHPNVWQEGDVCIEDQYQAGIGIPLDMLCEHIGQIIAYQKYNLQSPANRDEQLFHWIQTIGHHVLPTDPRDIRRARISFGNTPPVMPKNKIRFG